MLCTGIQVPFCIQDTMLKKFMEFFLLQRNTISSRYGRRPPKNRPFFFWTILPSHKIPLYYPVMVPVVIPCLATVAGHPRTARSYSTRVPEEAPEGPGHSRTAGSCSPCAREGHPGTMKSGSRRRPSMMASTGGWKEERRDEGIEEGRDGDGICHPFLLATRAIRGIGGSSTSGNYERREHVGRHRYGWELDL